MSWFLGLWTPEVADIAQNIYFTYSYLIPFIFSPTSIPYKQINCPRNVVDYGSAFTTQWKTSLKKKKIRLTS